MSRAVETAFGTSFATTDMFGCAYLLATGSVRLADVEWQQGRASFLLEAIDPIDFEAELADFRSGIADVNAREFVRSIQRLKSALFGNDRRR